MHPSGSGGTWCRRWRQLATSGGAITSASVNIPTSTKALHTRASLSLTFTEEKGDTPS